jgi:hypothetical protein
MVVALGTPLQRGAPTSRCDIAQVMRDRGVVDEDVGDHLEMFTREDRNRRRRPPPSSGCNGWIQRRAIDQRRWKVGLPTS